MDPNRMKTAQPKLSDRFRKSWLAPAAAAGALAFLAAASLRACPTPGGNPHPQARSETPATPQQGFQPPEPAARFELEYSLSAVLGGSASAYPFRRSLAGIAVGPGDRIYALGDGEVRVFDPGGLLTLGWKVVDGAACLAVGPDGRVYVGAAGRVEIYNAAGAVAGGFAAGEPGRPADVTAVKVHGNEILVADAAARLIRRYGADGRQLGLIGTRNKTGSFMLPNDWLDFDVDSKGVIRATDTGRHRVSAWALDGSPLGSFGKFGMTNPADFVGCCNPVNLACAPDGKIVTGEKMVARVKVYEPGGRLLAVIGPEHFDPDCEHIRLAVDSRGRILAADPVRREVKVFTPMGKVAAGEHQGGMSPRNHWVPGRSESS